MSEAEGNKSKLGRWCDWLAVAILLISIGLFLTTPAAGLGKPPSTTLETGPTFPLAFLYLAGSLVSLLAALLVLQLVTWYRWLKISRKTKAKRPAIWHLFALIVGLLLLAAPIPATTIKVDLPPPTKAP